jgi:hypothetical protein
MPPYRRAALRGLGPFGRRSGGDHGFDSVVPTAWLLFFTAGAESVSPFVLSLSMHERIFQTAFSF